MVLHLTGSADRTNPTPILGLLSDLSYHGSQSLPVQKWVVYDNEYTSIINIYFYEYFHRFKPWALALQNILDTLSNILDECLRFSLIKIEPVSIKPSHTWSLLLICCIYFSIKIVLINN